MPTRQGGSAAKNAITWLRRSCFLMTTFSAASIPWTWNTFFAISKPIVVICMWTALYVSHSNDHLMAIRRRERAPSTTPKPASRPTRSSCRCYCGKDPQWHEQAQLSQHQLGGFRYRPYRNLPIYVVRGHRPSLKLRRRLLRFLKVPGAHRTAELLGQ